MGKAEWLGACLQVPDAKTKDGRKRQMPKEGAMQRQLAWEDVMEASRRLGVLPCALEAVHEVESCCNGFLLSGRPKMLFDGHVFCRELKKRGIDPEPLQAAHGNLLCNAEGSRSRRNGMGCWPGGDREYKRLDEAMYIDEAAALCSASWGGFQVMGFNYALCGFASVQEFVAAQCDGAKAQLEAFCRFLENKELVVFLQKRDWAGFAKYCYWPASVANGYDKKLFAAYAKCRKAHGQGLA